MIKKLFKQIKNLSLNGKIKLFSLYIILSFAGTLIRQLYEITNNKIVFIFFTLIFLIFSFFVYAHIFKEDKK